MSGICSTQWGAWKFWCGYLKGQRTQKSISHRSYEWRSAFATILLCCYVTDNPSLINSQYLETRCEEKLVGEWLWTTQCFRNNAVVLLWNRRNAFATILLCCYITDNLTPITSQYLERQRYENLVGVWVSMCD